MQCRYLVLLVAVIWTLAAATVDAVAADATGAKVKSGADQTKRFHADLPEREFCEFGAEGFSSPVCGVIHRKETPASNGMPLGGIGTGCIDLETDGTFGYSTIFNSHVPRRGPLNLPFVGMCLKVPHTTVEHNGVLGQGSHTESWVLSTRPLQPDKVPGAPLPTSARWNRASPATDIRYWGHYPVADLEYDLDCPVSAGLRAWAPFIPGDVEASNIPGAVFELRLRNSTDAAQSGMVVFSFPGPSMEESAGHMRFRHTEVRGRFRGVVVSNDANQEYALGIVDDDPGAELRLAGDLGCDGGYWSRLDTEPFVIPGVGGTGYSGLPPVFDQPGACAGVPFNLAPGEEKTVRFVLAWHSPTWQGGGGPYYGGSTYHHKYAERYRNAAAAAEYLAANHASLLARILAWQQVVYADKTLPVWLRESLVNSLYMIAECGMWAQARPPIGDWCRKEDGLFAMIESPRACPQLPCVPCDFYGNLPLVYFFPELARSSLRANKAYQFPDGDTPWNYGTPGTLELTKPSRGYQQSLQGPCYVDMISRLWRRTGDRALLDEFYESMKRNTIFTMNLRKQDGPAGLVSITGQDWMESCELLGIVPHVGGVHLANLRMAERMAREVGDEAFAHQCAEWFRQGSAVLEEKTWTGRNYLLYFDPASGRRSDIIMGCQLDGEWMARFHGLEGAFPPDKARTVLATLRETNMYPHGATVFRMTGEEKFVPGYWSDAGVHFPSSIMLAATYLYHGQRDHGLDLAERTVRALVIANRASWDSILVFRGDNAEPLWGADYYQNMMLWSLPAAIAGTDLAGPSQPGGLVARMIKAAKP